jgi:hypothetical protein
MRKTGTSPPLDTAYFLKGIPFSLQASLDFPGAPGLQDRQDLSLVDPVKKQPLLSGHKYLRRT